MGELRADFQQWITRYGKAFVATPIYPYELEFKRIEEGQARLLKHAHGLVLNVGCGNDAIRPKVLATPGVTGYWALDYPMDIFEVRQSESNRWFGEILGKILMGEIVQNIDIWGDGNNLPMADNSVETVLLLEVLEHIKTPSVLLGEISRVMRKKGKLLISVPFIYPLHGGGEMGDYYRYTQNGLQTLLEQYGLTVQKFYPVGGIGTTLSLLIAHFLIRKCLDAERSKLLFWLRVFLVLPFFLLFNSIGRFLDMLGHWEIFADRYFVVVEKST